MNGLETLVDELATRAGLLAYADLVGGVEALLLYRGRLSDAQLLDMLAEEYAKFKKADAETAVRLGRS